MGQSIKRIAITGSAGQIAYSLIFRIASGELFGKEQPIALHLLELPSALTALEGVKMELLDCAFPLLKEINLSSDPLESFKDIDIALLVGSKPRGPGMERKDLLQENGKIFVTQGEALNAVAKKETKVFVIGNPCNTNCLIAMHHAPRLSRNNFYAMTRLDQNRASSFLAQKANVPITDVSHVTIWGNHSSTQVPDFFNATINHKPVTEIIRDREWLENAFMKSVRQRGAAIIQARGKSSAASAAEAILDSVKDRLTITRKNDWFSAGVISDNNPYNIEEGLVYSFPCHVNEQEEVSIHSGLVLNEFLITQLKISEQELIEERDLIKSFLN